jgi:hypothetical protein|tara:strand:+ start:966 stop:2561 length:1596 start_codon:yes stop_codon:yes gene_type:complete
MILRAIYKQISENRPVRLLELKGRQQGSSTGIAAYCFLRAICQPNTNALVITEEKGGSAANIFGMYERFLEALPFELKKQLTRQGQYMKFAKPLNSSIKVEGEKNVTSFTFQIVHLSEAAFFQNLGKTLSMLYQTVPDNPDTFICLETTANRYGDDFHTEWERASEGKSDFYPLFVPWYYHDEYSALFREDQDKETFERTLSDTDDSQYGNEEQILLMYPELTLENMQWRRHAIRNRCQGSVVEFNRQYPCSPEDAFHKSSSTIFDLAFLRKARSEYVFEPSPRTTLVGSPSGLQLLDDPEGIIQIWYAPEPYTEYVIGSDHAEGLDGRDFSAAIVLQRMPLRMVAKLRGFDGRQVSIDEFTEQLQMLGRYYNNAWICPENNADGGTVIALLQDKYEYQELVSERDLGVVTSNRLGWRNQSNTRRRGVGMVQESFHADEIEIPCVQTLNEAMNFVTINGKPQAIKKGKTRKPGEPETGFYDDLVFSLVGALYAEHSRPTAKSKKYLESQFHSARFREVNLPEKTDHWSKYV